MDRATTPLRPLSSERRWRSTRWIIGWQVLIQTSTHQRFFVTVRSAHLLVVGATAHVESWVRRRRRVNASRKECCSTFQSQLEWTSGARQQCVCRMHTCPRLQRSTVVDLRAHQVCRQLRSWTKQSSRSAHHCVINDVVVFEGFNVYGQPMPRTQSTIPIPVLCEGLRSSTRQDLLDLPWPLTQCTQLQEHRHIHSQGRSGWWLSSSNVNSNMLVIVASGMMMMMTQIRHRCLFRNVAHAN